MKPDCDVELSRLYSVLREERVDELARNRLVKRVLAGLEAGPSVSTVPLRGWSMGGLRASLTAAAGLVLVISAILWLRSDWMSGVRAVEFLSVQANGGVHLEWTNAGRDRYEVLKSTDPADFSRAERRQVRGTRYVDQSPDAARIVYYRVE